LPPLPPSRYAEEGTKAHELAEKIVRDWLSKNAIDHAWVETLRPEYADTTDDTGRSMVDYVMSYVAVCHDYLAELERPHAKPEVKLTLDEELALYGTVDFVASGTRGGKAEGLIVDLKYGRGVPVKAEGNPQLAYYATALKSMSRKALERVRVVIVQPRLEEWYSETVLEATDLDAWAKTFREGAERAYWQIAQKNPTFEAGEHCRFCPAKGVCNTHADYLNRQAGLDFVEPDDNALSQFVFTPEKLSKLLSVRQDVRAFLEAAEKYAMHLLRDGQTIPGWKLVPGRSRREWIADKDKVADGLVQLGVKEPYEKKLKGLMAVEKEIGKGKIEHLTIKPEGSPTLVPESDARRPVLELVGEEFK